MSTNEHLLTIVEPTTGGDATLELARDAVARGGRASVVIVITDRVDCDIRAYAESEEISTRDAEAIALDQFHSYCNDRIGGPADIVVHYGSLGSDLVKYVTTDTTAIAIPERLATDKLVQRIVAYSARPVIVAPIRPALVAA